MEVYQVKIQIALPLFWLDVWYPICIFDVFLDTFRSYLRKIDSDSISAISTEKTLQIET